MHLGRELLMIPLVDRMVLLLDVNGQMVDGMEKGALDFSRKNDQVRFDFPFEHSSITLAAWIKLDELKDYCAPIISSDSKTNGAASWYINQKGKRFWNLELILSQ